jgi:DNA-binding NarL/FixJ family response regulator
MDIRVVIIDDNIKFRESIKLLLERSLGYEVTGIYEDAKNIISKINESKPDVLLLDIEMPYVNGNDALIQIKAEFPELNVLMQTVFEDEELVFKAICNGACGYVLKNMPPEKLLNAISEAHEGGAPFSSIIAKKVLNIIRTGHLSIETNITSNEFKLTPRETEVLRFMVNGLSYKMIAAECSISFETVRYHIKNIYTKLHVATMTEAVAKAIKRKVIN